MKRVLIFGVDGQNRAYLTRLLLGKGYAVDETSRDAQTASFSGLHCLGIRDRVETVSMTLTDFRSVLLTCRSDCGRTFVPDACRDAGEHQHRDVQPPRSATLYTPTHLYNACSSGYFGDTEDIPASTRRRRVTVRGAEVVYKMVEVKRVLADAFVA